MNRIPKNNRRIKAFKPLQMKMEKPNPIKENSYRKNLKLERSPEDDALFLNSLETPDAEKMSRISKYASYLFGGF